MTTMLDGWRSHLWPIEPEEQPAFIPMVWLLFLASFTYSILRNLKDALLISSDVSGVEAIPFVKLWVLFPSAIVAACMVSYALSIYPRKHVVSVCAGIAALFFIVFDCFLYPHRESLQQTSFAHYIADIVPIGWRGCIALCNNWIFTLFYVVAELWGAIILQVLVWGLINDVTSQQQAPRFYGVLALFSGIASVMAGQLSALLSSNIFASWDVSLRWIIWITIAANAALVGVFFQVSSYETSKNQSNDEPTLSWKEQWSHLINSRHLLYIAILVLMYNLTINLVEVLWKDQVHQLYPTADGFNRYMNMISSIMGIISIIAAVIIVKTMKTTSWTISALATPIILLFTSGAFLLTLMVPSLATSLATIYCVSPLVITVFLGATQNCCAKAAKYTIYDASKEMAFIPLDTTTRMQGKVMIDGVGPKVAKSTSSALYQGMLIVFGSLQACITSVSIVVTVALGIWIISVILLGRILARSEQQSY